MFEELVAPIFFLLQVVIACMYLAVVLTFQLGWFLLSLVVNFLEFIFVNWIAQTLFAAWIAFGLQQSFQANSRKSQLAERRYNQKLEAVRELFEIVYERIYATRLYLSSLRDGEDEWIKERAAYKEVVKRWNNKAPNLLLLILTLLPAKYCYRFDLEVFPRFSDLDSLLLKIRRGREKGKLVDVHLQEEIENTITEVREIADVLMSDFLNIAYEDRKLLDRRPKIEMKNYEELGHMFLFKSLFKASMNS